MTVSEINTATVEGKLLMAALSQVTNQYKDPSGVVPDALDRLLSEWECHARYMYPHLDSDQELLASFTPKTFIEAITKVINQFSKENDSNTPDFILAEYLLNCLNAFTTCTNRREKWYGVTHEPGKTTLLDGSGSMTVVFPVGKVNYNNGSENGNELKITMDFNKNPDTHVDTVWGNVCGCPICKGAVKKPFEPGGKVEGTGEPMVFRDHDEMVSKLYFYDQPDSYMVEWGGGAIKQLNGGLIFSNHQGDRKFIEKGNWVAKYQSGKISIINHHTKK